MVKLAHDQNQQQYVGKITVRLLTIRQVVLALIIHLSFK